MPLFTKAGVARRPDPEPLETDDVRVVAVGTLAWALALVGLAVARLAGAQVRDWWLVMCACGAVLGLVGLRYCRRRRDALAGDDRRGERPAQDGAPRPVGPRDPGA